MMNNIKTFNFEGNEVRTIVKDGSVWWVAKDVCDALEIKNNRDVVARLEGDEKVSVCSTPLAENRNCQL